MSGTASNIFHLWRIPSTKLFLRNSKEVPAVMCYCRKLQTTTYEVVKGSYVPVTQAKPDTPKESMIGHSLGAAGGLEAIAFVKNLEPEVDIDTVPNVKKKHEVNVATWCYSFSQEVYWICLVALRQLERGIHGLESVVFATFLTKKFSDYFFSSGGEAQRWVEELCGLSTVQGFCRLAMKTRKMQK